MAIRPDWEVGTITLIAGSTDFTTTNSALQTAAISAGDEIITPTGLVLIIAEITGQNAGQLMLPCPAGAAGANQPLRIRYQPDGSRVQGAMRMVRELLVTGNLDAFATLAGRPNAVPVFTGFGALSLMDTDMLGGGSAGGWDATVFDSAGLDAYADRPAGYRVMVIDAGELRSAVFQKLSEAASDWSQPIYFTGKDGRPGEQGEAGNDFEPDAIGLLSDRSLYNNQPAGFAFLATDAAALYFRQGAVGDWSVPIPFGAGKPGANGLSAYQIAVQEGFTGTQAEWIASLHGSDASVTTANVGAAVAAAAGEQSISDADSLAGVKSGTSSMRRWTWGIVKAWIKGWITKADVDLDNVANKSEAQMVASGAIANKFASQQQLIESKLPADGVAEDSAKLEGKTTAQLPLLGVGQSWLEPTRAMGIVYQNTTGKPIMIGVRLTSATATLEVSSNNYSWIIVGYGSQTSYLSVYAVVPNNHYYRATGGGTSWVELR